MDLSAQDMAMLAGDQGEAARLAIEMIIAVGRTEDAPHLIDIEGGHVDGCLYHGRASLDFAEHLVDLGAVVDVPTTMNVSSLDRLHPGLYRGDQETAELAGRLMDSYERMGCRPTWTCAPYQLPDRPRFGAQIAWGESNAIVFANSVIGARTNRYGDFLDICCAIAGRVPNTGLHTDAGRRGTLVFDVRLPDHMLDDDVVYVLIGHHLGRSAGAQVPVIVGLDDRASEDRLKALGAAAASSGSVGLLHAVGVTPEAPDLETATCGAEPLGALDIDLEALRAARAELNRGSGHLGAVSVGTPHMSLEEMRTLVSLIEGHRSKVPFYVNTGRHTVAEATDAGLVGFIESFGATLVTDTCTYLTPIIGPVGGDVMTNSGKWAYYAPANLGVTVRLGSMAECVRSAVAGSVELSSVWE